MYRTSRRYRKSSFYTSFQRVPNDFQLQDFFRRSSSNTQIHVKGEDPLYTYVFSHLWRNLIRFFLLRWFYCLQIHKRMFTCIVHGNWHGKLHCHSTLQIEKQSKKIRIIRKNFKNYWFFHLWVKRLRKWQIWQFFQIFQSTMALERKRWLLCIILMITEVFLSF